MPKLKLPYSPSENEEEGHKYEILTIGEKYISDYTKLSFLEIEELRIDIYLGLLRDAFIHTLSKTESGQEYLDNAWVLEQSNPDRERLRETFQSIC